MYQFDNKECNNIIDIGDTFMMSSWPKLKFLNLSIKFI